MYRPVAFLFIGLFIGLFFGTGIGFLWGLSRDITLDRHDHQEQNQHGHNQHGHNQHGPEIGTKDIALNNDQKVTLK